MFLTSGKKSQALNSSIEHSVTPDSCCRADLCLPTGWHHFLVSLQDSWVTFPLGYLECRVGRFADEVLYLELVSVSQSRQDDVTFLFYPAWGSFTSQKLAWHTRSADWTFGQSWQPGVIGNTSWAKMHKMHTHSFSKLHHHYSYVVKKMTYTFKVEFLCHDVTGKNVEKCKRFSFVIVCSCIKSVVCNNNDYKRL